MLARLQGQAGRPLRVIMLDRDRHRPLMTAVEAAGASLSLILDGDVMGALLTALPGAVASGSPRFDLYVGSGGAPEGVLAAAGLQALGGSMFGRLIFRDDDERERAARIADLSRGWGRYRSPSDKVKYSRYFGPLRRNKFPWPRWRSLDSSWPEGGI